MAPSISSSYESDIHNDDAPFKRGRWFPLRASRRQLVLGLDPARRLSEAVRFPRMLQIREHSGYSFSAHLPQERIRDKVRPGRAATFWSNIASKPCE